MPRTFTDRVTELCEHIKPGLDDLERVESGLGRERLANNAHARNLAVGVPLFVMDGITNVMRATHQELTFAIEATRPDKP